MDKWIIHFCQNVMLLKITSILFSEPYYETDVFYDSEVENASPPRVQKRKRSQERIRGSAHRYENTREDHYGRTRNARSSERRSRIQSPGPSKNYKTYRKPQDMVIVNYTQKDIKFF